MLYFFGIVTTALVGAATYFVFHTTKRQITLPAIQSKEVEGAPIIKGEGIPRTSLQELQGQAPTVYHVFTRAVEKYANKPCYGYRPLLNVIKEEKNINGVNKIWEYFELGPYKQLTYKEVQDKVHVVASGYRAIGVKERDIIGIFEETCLEWSLTAHAAFSISASIATVYSTLGEEAVAFAINQTKLSYLLTNGRLLGTLAKATSQCPTLKHIVYVDQPDEKGLESLNQRGVRTYSFDELIALGSKALVDPIPPKPDDVAVIMYTSGSTGNPKGVVIRHQSVAAAITSVIQGSHYVMKDDDVYISFLPLAHVLAFVAQNAMLDHGVYVGFGNPRSLVDSAVRNCRGDFAELRPTLMAGVPTIFDRIKKGARDKIEKSGALTHTLFNFAYNLKKKAIAQDADTPFWNKLVFDKLKAQMGGRIRVMLSGGAPLSRDTQEFLRICFSCRVIQGYGLTETCGGAAIMNVDDIGLSIAGAPLPGSQIKLVDVEEMNYKSTNNPPQGEIWIKGANVSDGYFLDEEQTNKAFIDGWFCTGDVGEWTPQGTLKIIDRVKNLVKLSHGEYIALENVESKLKNSPYVDNICVYGDGLRAHLVALIVPSRQRLIEWAQANKIPSDNFEALCNLRKARSEVLSSVISAGRAAKLKTTELPKDVFLCHEEWTPQNSMLTAAMKLKRPTLNQTFKSQIEAMYAEEN